jgi:hypothetical protein
MSNILNTTDITGGERRLLVTFHAYIDHIRAKTGKTPEELK